MVIFRIFKTLLLTVWRLVVFIWPPIGVFVTNRSIKRKHASLNPRSTWDATIQTTLRHLEGIKEEEYSGFARQVAESEAKRREIIEGKAGVFLQSSALATTIIAVVPTLNSPTGWALPAWVAAIVGIVYFLATVHFLVAIYYAVQVRRVSGLYVPSADEFFEFYVETRIKLKATQAIADVARAKLNEPLLLVKSNCLDAAEQLFTRGLALIAAAAVTAMAAFFVKQYSPDDDETNSAAIMGAVPHRFNERSP